MRNPADQRHELGRFLRSRRERLSPAEAGLPRTSRRRTPGLRREELAVLAGISATWYTYLEQGRDVQASDQVLGALATALGLDRPEEDHLFRLAGRAREDVAEPEPLAAEVAAVPGLLQPHPAYVISATYDVLAHNEAAAALFPSLAGQTPNFVRWTFTAQEARHVVVEWEREARGLLARLRALAGRHPGDERFTRLIDDLHEASPEVRAWWPHHEVQAQRPAGRKRLRHPGLGPLDYAFTAFHPAEQPEQTLVVYSDPRPC
ncbi:helix-turn-helix transcriptional regulator [Lentzea sp. NPDC060358]|uniref:helix-turn-helix transcriptional regulator n=1 Tax=Lentzea sp. NPDC060358 TaxID=3347103 RepID=UPI00366782F5